MIVSPLQPSDLCQCMHTLIEGGQIRVRQTVNTTTGTEGVLPYLSNGKRSDRGVLVMFCPGCGQRLFKDGDA